MPPPAPSQPTANERYTLKLCNRSSKSTIYGAVAVFDSPEAEYVTVHAWYKIARGACANVATRRFGKFSSHVAFVHAQSGRFVWPPPKSGESKLCVDTSRAYERLGTPGYKCKNNEQLRAFRKIKIAREVGTDMVFTYNFD